MLKPDRKPLLFRVLLVTGLSVSSVPAFADDEAFSFVPMQLNDDNFLVNAGESPNLVDVTRDGLPDLVFNRRDSNLGLSGKLIFIENDGEKIPFARRLNSTQSHLIEYDQGEVVATYESLPFIKLADVNGDTLPDIVIQKFMSSSQNEVSVAYNTGSTPRFTAPVFIANLETSSIDFLADMDGDDDLDVVAGNKLLINLGSPTQFGPLSASVDISPRQTSFANAIGDIDGDGDLDFVSSSTRDGGYAMLNNGTGQPFDGVTPVSIADAAFRSSVENYLADLNNDGRPDLIRVGRGRIAYYLNNGLPTLFDRTPVLLGGLQGPCRIEIAKISNDAFADLIADCDGQARLFVNSGDTIPFASGDTGVETSVVLSRHSAAIDDIDADGDMDILSSIAGIRMYLNNGFVGVPMPVLSYPKVIEVSEDAGRVDIKFELNGPQAAPVTLEFGTLSQFPDRDVPGYARQGHDFYGVFERVTFAPGEVEKVVSVIIVDDNLIESDEKFFGLVSFYSGANVPTERDRFGTLVQTQIQVNIKEDGGDDVALLSIRGATTEEFEGKLRFEMRLDQASSLPVSVSLATIGGSGTATPGRDYWGKYEVIEFLPGERFKTFVVDVIYDFIDEGSESFDLNVFNVVNARYDGGRVSGVIRDDPQAQATIDNPRMETVVEGQPITFSTRIDRPLAQVVTVRLTTRSFTADQGQDYYGAYTLVTFNPGETQKSVTITTLDDTEIESSESFGVRLINPVGGVGVPYGTNDETVVTIEDND